MRNRPVSFHEAAAAGLLFALAMCTWKYIDGVQGFDELAIRFAVYFGVFTLGFRWLTNLWLKHRGAGR